MKKEILFRDRLEEFFILRKAARRQQAWLHQQGSPLVTSPESTGNGPATIHPDTPLEEGDANSLNGPVSPPPWMRILESFTTLEKTIRVKMETLHNCQTEYFSPKFISEEEEERQKKEIDKQTTDLQKLLKEQEHMVKTGIRASNMQNGDEVRAANNVQLHLITRLNLLLGTFKEGQTWYVQQVKRRENKVKKFKNIGSAEVYERLEKEEKVAAYMEMGYSQVEISELLVIDAQAQETNQEVQNILQSVQELHDMFAELKGMVVEQGTVLDRIDYNIEQAATKIGGGTVQLQKAREQQKKCCIS